MNSRIDQLVKTLLQRDNLEQCSLSELKDYADRHPYFGAAQLLLTKKLQEHNDGAFDQQLQKTLLFFNNPIWVEHLLNETTIVATRPKAREIPETEEDRIENEADREEFEPAETMEEEMPSAVEAEIKIPAMANVSNSEMLFEPFHTVDYFASQGIKFKEEEKPVDKFGKQLKSFTEWLKTMKRLPVTELAADIPPATESKVEEMAQISLKEPEVITEAMAEVWAKQGNHSRAMDIYRKLSLLEPSKSAYFATKIEGLKK